MSPHACSMEVDQEITSVLDLIQRRTREKPDHPAVSIGSQTVSYRQLDNAASIIAQILLKKGVQRGDFVPVLATRSAEMIACFLGVLKAGACYVPIDIEVWSTERVAWTLETVAPSVLVNLGSDPCPQYAAVSLAEVKAALGFDDPETRTTDCASHLVLHQPRIQPDNLAYMIFTSGTTSTPKGVMIPHSALLNYAQQGDQDTPFNCNATPDDKILLIFSPGFDASVGVIFSALCSGAQLIVSSTTDLLDCAARSTILVATPSVLAALGEPEETCAGVRTIILGGEAPPSSLVSQWWTPDRNIYNAYGLTETTIMSLIGRVVPGRPITLGKEMADTHVILLDGDVESDSYGEMCITGPGLALGYYKNEALTAQKFIMWHGERIYRTGDFARKTENGLEFAGRADSLVKNRGFLVNLESQVIPMLLAAGASTATAFMYRKQLVAFVTPQTLDVMALRQLLAGRHDEYLVPDRIRAMESLPLTPNGKADNRALERVLAIEDSETFTDEEEEDVKEKGDFDGERTSKMDILKAAVAAATSFPLSKISHDKSFWEMGGNSLAAVRVVSFLRRKHLTLGLKALFDLPNLVAVCAALQEETQQEKDVVQHPSGKPSVSVGPMSSLQSKMVQGSLKLPGLNYMVFHIHMPLHPGTMPDIARLRGAWHQVLQRHAVFRTVYSLNDGLQKIQPELQLDWHAEETTAKQLSAVTRARSLEIHSRLLNVAADDMSENFHPVNALRMITVPGKSSTLLISVHHAQVDGWSLSIIFNEVQDALMESNGTAITATPPIQFIRVAEAQEELQKDPQGIAFWSKLLLENQTAFPRLNLPRPPPSEVPAAPDWIGNITVPLDMNRSTLEKAGRRLRVIPSSLVYTAWGLVLSNYTFSERVAFGTILSGRNLATQSVPDVEGVVGPLLNTVPFMIQFTEGEQTILECVTSVYGDLMSTIEHQWSAAEVMAAMSGESISNAMQTIVATEYDVPPMQGSWTIEHQDFMLEFGLSLLIERDDAEGLQATLLLDDTRFASAGIRRLLLHFRNALRGLADPANVYIQDVRARLLSDDERTALVGDSATEDLHYTGQTTVKAALDAAAAQWPDECALESEQHGTMTYRELGQASNRLARQLRSHMRGRERVVVGVLTDRSMHWVIGVMAVIKAGGICCPLDVTMPAKRIEAIIETSGAEIFLSATRECTLTIDFRRNGRVGQDDIVIPIDEFLESSQSLDASPLDIVVQTEDVVYLVFTSGTTGVPKGFDIALVDMFGTLCYGGTLVLRDRGDPFEHLKRVHATNMTPSVLGALLPEDYKHLDTIGLAGEPVSQSMADTWGVGRNLRNSYGPSECGPITTTTRLQPGVKVTIGRGLPGVSVYILDRWQCPVPQGITGELCISGQQITPGYWKDSGGHDQTPRHVKNPFASSSSSSQLMYRTGDLGSWNDDMTIRYVGRIDNQVKVRGFRVELEEVEQAIIAADLTVRVQSAVVLVVSDTEILGQEDKRIVGFVTPHDVDVAALRAQIALVLPSYMRPSRILALDELPRSQNGKADRKALQALAISARSVTGTTSTTGEEVNDDQGVGAQDKLTATEELISKAWRELLGLRAETRIPKDQDFLALGGNSVLLIKVARTIASSVGRHVSVALLVRRTVLEDLARSIDEQAAASVSEAGGDTFSAYLSTPRVHESTSTSKESPLSYLETEIFHSHYASDTKSAFNTTFQFVVRGVLKKDVFFEAFNDVVRINPILRARYRQVAPNRPPYRLISDSLCSPKGYKGNEWDPAKMQAAVDEPFDLANDPLLRLIIWERKSNEDDKPVETMVMLITHHIVTDRASISIMLQLVSQKYKNLIESAGNEVHSNGLPDAMKSTGTYIDWARWLLVDQQNFRSKTQLEKKAAYWRENLRGMQPIPWHQTLTHDIQRQTISSQQNPGSTQHFHIPLLGNASVAYSQRLAVAATGLALRAVLGTSDTVVALPYMNRDDPATANMLGLFVDRIPLRFSVADGDLTSASALLDRVASATHQAVEKQIPYSQIRAALASAETDSRSICHLQPTVGGRFVDILVIYNWQTDALEKSVALGPNLHVSGVEPGRAAKATGSMFPLLFDYSEDGDGGLLVELEFNPDIVPRRVVENMGAVLPEIVQGLAHLDRPDSIVHNSQDLLK